jgi:hypothetical protein
MHCRRNWLAGFGNHVRLRHATQSILAYVYGLRTDRGFDSALLVGAGSDIPDPGGLLVAGVSQ